MHRPAIFQGAADFDLELIESRTLDGNIQELTYRPTLHGATSSDVTMTAATHGEAHETSEA